MSRVIHFDLSADDPERAVIFNRDVFRWKIEKWDGPMEYWMITNGDENDPGITGGIADRVQPKDSTAVVFDVPSVDESTERVQKSGGRMREPKQTIPGAGYLVMCVDTDGNTFGIMEIDESAKL
jgi:predicted enzyme related to lactoylglutathione lyase